jgi:peroxiredoxin
MTDGTAQARFPEVAQDTTLLDRAHPTSRPRLRSWSHCRNRPLDRQLHSDEALGHRDAFPESDLGLLRAATRPRDDRLKPAELLKMAERWRPLRIRRHAALALGMTARAGGVENFRLPPGFRETGFHGAATIIHVESYYGSIAPDGLRKQEVDMGGQLERKQLVEGDRAPEFEFVTRDAKRLRSSELLRQGPLLLTFYRGAWCMCCQSDLRDLMRAMPAIRRTGSTVLGVFHDLGPEGNDRIVSECGLDFPLVDDADGSVAEAFRARQYVLKPARCQRTTVSRLTIFKASRTPGASRYNPANTRRSMLVKVIRCGDLRRSTLS